MGQKSIPKFDEDRQADIATVLKSSYIKACKKERKEWNKKKKSDTYKNWNCSSIMIQMPSNTTILAAPLFVMNVNEKFKITL